MKKILLTVALAMCLTACGNVSEPKEKKVRDNNLVENEVKNEQIIEQKSESNEVIKEEDEENTINIEEDVKKEKTAEVNQDKLAKSTGDNKEVEERQLEPSVESNKEVLEQPKSEIIYEEGIDVGKKAIDFEFELLSGEKTKLSDYSGKPVFLNFWATWCGPCVREMPDIEKVKTEYGDELVVIAINGGELKEDVEAFISKKGFTFYIGVNERGDILEKYDSMYIPLSVFIDKDGIIRERKVGALSYEDMKNIVESLTY